ncbi:MAG: LuxR C-terminal-related transcriptional regulator [Oscillospiraceae bacterium]|nr:LuxR C-terminal-related transcriptional regulator [Oscillospiraceae bacterium]
MTDCCAEPIGIDAALPANSFISAQFMERQRIDLLLERATSSKLVYLIAGAGYGKTLAVRHYLEKQEDAVIRWVQLTEADNIGSRYWDNLTHNVAFDNPDLAERLREFGFPETQSRFKQFAEILKDAEHRAIRTFLVLDDFHLIHTEQALKFAERCAHLQIPGACVIIISRKEPEINVVSLFSKGQVSIITEDELRFTESEILEFFKQRSIAFSAKNLPQLLETTKGWALAIQLFSLVLGRIPTNLELAFDTMKQNIFKLMEIEAYDDFPDATKKLLVKLSLVSNLPFSILKDLFLETSILHNAPGLAAFVWFDSFTGADRVHPLYWEFLQSKQDILSTDEKGDVYKQAISWCAENNFCLDTMYYMSKAEDYDSMVELLFSYPFKLPHDTCEYFVEIIENIEINEKNNLNPSILMLKYFFIPLLLVGMGKYQDAQSRALDTISKWEGNDSQIATRILYASYSNLVYIDMYICTANHIYNSPKYIEKAMEYYKISSLPFREAKGAFFVPDIRSLACSVGVGANMADFDRYLDATEKTAVFVEKTHHSMYYGFVDLVQCELAFFRNEPDVAKSYANIAISKAREKNQYSVESMTLHYLLRIALHEGDYPLAREALKQLRESLDNTDFWNRHLMYDLFTGFFLCQIGLPKMVPSWLVMDEKDEASEVRSPSRELLVGVKAHITSGKYNQALIVLNNSSPRSPYEQFLLSELALHLLSAVARSQTGDASGAVREFAMAYSLSLDGVFEMPFIELGKHMRPLISDMAKVPNHGIPDGWLKSIERKASIYAKKVSALAASYRKDQNMEESISLSPRELEVLADLYQGLSREEIADNRYLSVNTVKKILQSIYLKLDANNNVDAIRIAMENNLIEV